MFRLRNTRPLMARAGRMGLAGATVIVAMCALGASSAIAAPTGEYAVFAQCPTHAAGVEGCLAYTIESGEIKVGNEQVPLPQVLQGGLLEEEEPYIKRMAPALNGETLVRSEPKWFGNPVTGGLAGLMRCDEIANLGERLACNTIFAHGTNGVNAVTELAGPASSVVLNAAAAKFGEGVALALPVKVKLENPLLGNECYIGSDTEPIILEMTTGATSPPAPNVSITGNYGEQKSKDEGGILVVSDHTLVDNSFAAPAASGCGGAFSSVIDPIINARLGLPSGAGHNTAIFTGTSEIANSEFVAESEPSTTTTSPPPPPRHHRRWGMHDAGAHDHRTRNRG